MDHRIATKVAAAAALALCVSGAQAADLDLSLHAEAGLGTSQYRIVPNGTWYQVGAADNHVETRGMPWLVGVTGDIVTADRAGLSYHADYLDLGHLTSACQCTTIDADYNHETHLLIANAPTARYVGSGDVHGLKLSLAPYLSFGATRIGVEAGELIYADNWHESVYGWGAGMHLQPRNGSFSTASNIHAAHLLGIYATRDHLTVSYEWAHLQNNLSQRVPPLYVGMHALMVTYSF
ncbi:hypothetical protein [Rhodanobacter hydrolyticus]|uniref:MipA/OmpV family protein n=1 Tax=Rhodanobacter hydrolyticus TaxID=2250595 RepID=A0ABW8J3S3_9GAMM